MFLYREKIHIFKLELLLGVPAEAQRIIPVNGKQSNHCSYQNKIGRTCSINFFFWLPAMSLLILLTEHCTMHTMICIFLLFVITPVSKSECMFWNTVCHGNKRRSHSFVVVASSFSSLLNLCLISYSTLITG